MASEEHAIWHYVSDHGERLGPVTIHELSDLAFKRTIKATTMVWREGLSEWIPAENIADQLRESHDSRIAAAPPESDTMPSPTAAPEPAAPQPKTEAPASEPLQLTPRKASFVFPRIAFALLLSIFLAAVVAVALAANHLALWPAGLMVAFGLSLGIFASLAAYRKERYEIHDTRVICHRGGLVSDQVTQLEIRNITHVKIKLPWLRFKFFGVGYVIIESAGNAKPIILRVIRDPESIYSMMRDRMQKNGYDLTQERLIHEEQPALIGIIGECLGLLMGSLVAAMFTLPALFTDFKGTVDSSFEWALKGILVLVAIGVVTYIVVRFLDLQRRTYRVFNDVVVYEEGFLTRNNAFIPYENIADSNTKCSFFDRLLSLYNVEISCQGSGSKIEFRRLRYGVALSAAIDQLVVLASEKPKLAARSSSKRTTATSPSRPRRADLQRVPAGEAWVAELGLSPARLIIPLLFLIPLVPIWIIAMIQAGVRIMSTRYSVRPGSLRHSYRFLTAHDREFAYDKITGLVIKQNLWDRWFGTMTLRFWSIGSGEPMEFAHIQCSEVDLPALMRQIGIPAPSAEPYQAETSFGLMVWLRAHLRPMLFLFIIIDVIIVAAYVYEPAIGYLLGIPFLAVIIAYFHARFYYSSQRLSFHEHHVEAEQGIIAKRRYFARYSNLKKTQVTRYPSGNEGSLEIFVAGEEEIAHLNQPQQKGQQKMLKPCSFTTALIPNVRVKGLLLDDILCSRVEPSPQAVPAAPFDVLAEAPRSVGNAVAKLLLLSILLFPLIALLPITLPLTIMRVKRWRYRIETERIVKCWGIFYRSEASVLLDRVDSLQQSQGPLNKMFKNGNVSIMTAGSSKPDLTIIDSPDYFKLYEIIREHSD